MVEELALALVIVLVTAVFFAALGLFFSSLARTTLVATVLTYAVALFITIGLPVLLGVYTATVYDTFYYGTSSSFVEGVLTCALHLMASVSPITAAIFTEVALLNEYTVWFFWDSGVPIPSAWLVYTPVYLASALLLLAVVLVRVGRQARR